MIIICNRQGEILPAWIMANGIIVHDTENKYNIDFAIGLEYDEVQRAAADEIKKCKRQLKDTDYKAIKFSDGAITEEEYAPVREQRAEWRARINEIESSFIPPSITREEMDEVERIVMEHFDPELLQ